MRTKVEDVMTRQVTSVTGSTPFKDVAEAIITHGISAVPVVDGEGHVLGVVSETDLLYKEEFRELYYQEGYRPPLRMRLRQRDARRKATGDTAADLMTQPAVTVASQSSTVAAARTMDQRGVKRLIVVDDEGRLLGVVSRRDLLKVFVRPDVDLAEEILDEVLERSLWVDTSRVKVAVHQGVATLSGRMNRRTDAETAVRMTQRVNGVVDVVDELSWDEDDTHEARWR